MKLHWPFIKHIKRSTLIGKRVRKSTCSRQLENKEGIKSPHSWPGEIQLIIIFPFSPEEPLHMLCSSGKSVDQALSPQMTEGLHAANCSHYIHYHNPRQRQQFFCFLIFSVIQLANGHACKLMTGEDEWVSG